MHLFNREENRVPVWFMRQAGRYHKHYQNIRKDREFMKMCKDPDLACEITLGPIEDFGFDAAILFSDLLFPLEHLGMGLNYLDGPPKLAFHIEEKENLKKIAANENADEFYKFQADAIVLLNKKLPKGTSLLGFVGAPFTLFSYAACGAHAGALLPAKSGLYDGRFDLFWEHLKPSLMAEMRVQAKASPTALCLFDTAVGELCLEDYKTFIVPKLNEILVPLKNEFPELKIIYYSRNTQSSYFRTLKDTPIDVIGVDWRNSMESVIEEFSDRFYIQGNIDPTWLFLPWQTLHSHLEDYKKKLLPVKKNWNKWIFGLGHGVLPKTPEENVKNTVKWVKENLTY
jgi:uroporphyrinogen decarboxylase